MQLRHCFWILLMVLHPSVWAVPNPIVVKAQQISPRLQQGVYIGGEHGREFSLISLQVEKKVGKIERIIVKMGDAEGKPLKEEMPYFHISLERNPARIVMDIDEVQRTRFDSVEFKTKMRASEAIASSDFTMDPEDHSTNLIFNLKKPVALSVTRIDARGELILELTPAEGSSL